jgi:hypothetical protein
MSCTQTSPAPARYARKSSGWDNTRRAKHAASMRNWAPWKHSTGPRTSNGKAASCLNAYKHGLRGREIKVMNRFIRDCGKYAKCINDGLRVARHLKKQGIHMDVEIICKAILKLKKIENPTNELLKDFNLHPCLQPDALANTHANNKHNAKILHFRPPWGR